MASNPPHACLIYTDPHARAAALHHSNLSWNRDVPSFIVGGFSRRRQSWGFMRTLTTVKVMLWEAEGTVRPLASTTVART